MKRSSLFFVLLFAMRAAAQDDPVPVKHKMGFRDVYVMTGITMESMKTRGITEFSMLAPNSKLLPIANGFEGSDGLGASLNTLLNINLGFNFSDKQRNYYKPNPQFRLGISFFSHTSLSCDYHYEDRKPWDTIYSGTDTTYLDSVVRQHIHMEYGSDQLRLDASLIFRTNRSRRLTLYTGFGITAGFAVSAYTTIDYRVRRWAEQRDSSGVYGDTTARSQTSEYFHNRKGPGVSAYIPIGIDFRIGKRKESLKRLHLFIESRPFIAGIIIPELFRNGSFGLDYCFGVRYTLD